MSQETLIFVLIGFGAQLIDGALGMAFGVLSTTSMLAFGVPPAAASAITHVLEALHHVCLRGLAHIYHRNID